MYLTLWKKTPTYQSLNSLVLYCLVCVCFHRSKSHCPVSSHSNPAVTCKYLASQFAIAIEQLHENCCNHLMNTENVSFIELSLGIIYWGTVCLVMLHERSSSMYP